MRPVRPDELAARAAELDAAWRNPGIPDQQLVLAKREMVAWRAGGQHGPFDALKSLLESIDRRAEILNLGAGSGYESAVLMDDLGFRRVVGADYSEAMVACAKEAWGEEEPGISGSALVGRERRFEVADARALPYDSESFDLVIEGCIMLHLASGTDRISAVNECARVARRWVLLHRTPISASQETTTWIKDAYGVECAEVHVSEAEYEGLLAGARLSVIKRVEWSAAEGVARSDLCEVTR